MEKKRHQPSNRVVGVFNIDNIEYECVQFGGFQDRPSYLGISTGEYHLGYIKGDYSLDGEEVIRRLANVRLKGKDSEYYVEH